MQKETKLMFFLLPLFLILFLGFFNTSLTGYYVGNLYDNVFSSPSKSVVAPIDGGPTTLVCTNECFVAGSKRCVGTIAYITCGNYDSDSCLEYGSTVNCLSGYVCTGNGTCVVSSISPTIVFHSECSNNKCLQVEGSGTNQCNMDSDCQSIITPAVSAGSLSISSNPQGAEVYLNNRLEGSTPLIINGLLVGTYNLKISKGGYQDTFADAVVKSDETSFYGFVLTTLPVKDTQGTGIPIVNSTPSQQTETHTICQNSQCFLVQGSGINQCSANSDCLGSIDNPSDGAVSSQGSQIEPMEESSSEQSFVYQDSCDLIGPEVRLRVKKLKDAGQNIVLKEGEKISGRQYFVIPGQIIQVISIHNSSSLDPRDDEITFRDGLTGQNYKSNPFFEGSGEVVFGGEKYSFIYRGAYFLSDEEKYVAFNYPQTVKNVKSIFVDCLAHRSCSGNKCLSVNGGGKDACTSDRQCLSGDQPKDCSYIEGTGFFTKLRRYFCERF